MQLNKNEYLEDLIKKRNYEIKRKRIEKVRIASYPVFWSGMIGLYCMLVWHMHDYNKDLLLILSVLAGLCAISDMVINIKERMKNLEKIKKKINDLNVAIRNELESEFNKQYPSIYWATKEDKIEYLRKIKTL